MVVSGRKSEMLADLLRSIKPTPATYISAARQIEAGRFDHLTPVRVGILATFTADFLRPYFVVEGAARRLRVQPHFAPFNQLEQQALDPSSALHAARPDVVVVAARLEDLAPRLVGRFVALSAQEIDDELEAVRTRLAALLDGLRRVTTATILVFNFAPPLVLTAGLADPALPVSQTSVVQRANDHVAMMRRALPGTYVFDYARIVAEFGLRRWYDLRLLYMGRIPFGAEAQLEVGRQLARYLRALLFPPCKCLVLDLDNTLWGGVLGEEGLGGIALGEDHPGIIYKDFQRAVLVLKDRGVLLAVASKNTEADVREVFERHPDCVLRTADFVAMQIHWGDKASSLKAIAEELSIGTDSLAVFDDSPVEREWIRTQMPEVWVIEVPEQAEGFAEALLDSGAFDHLEISSEDLVRTELYHQMRERGLLAERSASPEEFLRSLEMIATIGVVGPETLPRTAQLLAKTNQFNLTTRRHSATDLQEMIEAGGIALWMRVTDRFGDNGIVGVAIAVSEGDGDWRMDSFLLSCRVVGRGVEGALLGTLARLVRARGGHALIGEYIPTPKNSVTKDFYQNHGFVPLDVEKRRWRYDLGAEEMPIPDYIRVRLNE